jgi:hypothetical protein
LKPVVAEQMFHVRVQRLLLKDEQKLSSAYETEKFSHTKKLQWAEG